MNYSTLVFLVNDQARAVNAIYESTEGAKKYLFKTFDQTLKVGDHCVVESTLKSSIGLAVVRITELDVEFDLETDVQLKWLIGKVDQTSYLQGLSDEDAAIKKVRAKEMLKKKADLIATMNLDEATIQSMALAQPHQTALAAPVGVAPGTDTTKA